MRLAWGQILEIVKRLSANTDLEVSTHASLVQKILNPEDVEDFKHLIRTVINDDVVHGDIFEPTLGLQDPQSSFDVVTANFVAESVAENLSQWRSGMKNILSHVEENGYFVQTAIKNASWYQVGKERLPAFGVDEVTIAKLLEEEGYCIIYQKTLEGSDSSTVGYEGMVFTLAKKLSR